REESASTNQLDFIASKRFDLTYKDKDGKDKPVYVIHRAPLGSHERFVAFLIEHYAGSFPLWLSPEQIWVIPVSEKAYDYARQVKETLKNARVVVKNENETMGKKIRQGELLRIPYLLIVGEKEASAHTVSVRQRSKGDIGQMQLPEFQKKVETELKERI
ncbi:MAG: His/Gly/Thr/Pro-type tRNA ligase C-terminal domain-containing protein, partial [bacterium]|nr:His/Gly/Thr/Pro-type tRNA ligase C-terminal domain-containing protein [bacterium]